MKFDMKAPCNDCPFRREGGITLTEGRVAEIGGMMLSSQGGTFPCHKTTREGVDGDLEAHAESQHCAGALAFAEKNGNATQMMRIAERLGLYDRAGPRGADLVWADLDEWLENGTFEAGEPKQKRRAR